MLAVCTPGQDANWNMAELARSAAAEYQGGAGRAPSASHASITQTEAYAKLAPGSGRSPVDHWTDGRV
ncbi:MAG: hypothetical protein ACLPJH_04110 [Myxococcaceae bacterium]